MYEQNQKTVPESRSSFASLTYATTNANGAVKAIMLHNIFCIFMPSSEKLNDRRANFQTMQSLKKFSSVDAIKGSLHVKAELEPPVQLMTRLVGRSTMRCGSERPHHVSDRSTMSANSIDGI